MRCDTEQLKLKLIHFNRFTHPYVSLIISSVIQIECGSMEWSLKLEDFINTVRRVDSALCGDRELLDSLQAKTALPVRDSLKVENHSRFTHMSSCLAARMATRVLDLVASDICAIWNQVLMCVAYVFAKIPGIIYGLLIGASCCVKYKLTALVAFSFCITGANCIITFNLRLISKRFFDSFARCIAKDDTWSLI